MRPKRHASRGGEHAAPARQRGSKRVQRPERPLRNAKGEVKPTGASQQPEERPAKEPAAPPGEPEVSVDDPQQDPVEEPAAEADHPKPDAKDVMEERLSEVASQNAERVKELEAKVAELSASLGALHEKPGAASVDDQMQDLLRLSELISVRYNPFLKDEEPALYDDQDVRRFLPKKGAQMRPGSEVIPVSQEYADAEVVPVDGPPVAQPAQRGRDDDQTGMHHDEPGDLRVVEAEEGVASETTPESGGPHTNAPGSHDVAPDAMKVGAAPPSADQSRDLDAALDLSGETSWHQAGEQVAQEPRAALDAAPEPPEVEAPAVQRPEPEEPEEPMHHEPHTRPARPRPVRAVPGPSPRQSHHVLSWFERLASEGDPSEIHLFVEHYARLGWIPAQHVDWMRLMADAIAPARDDLLWEDLELPGVELARMHQRHLRFLQRLFDRPRDDPDHWGREADALWEDD